MDSKKIIEIESRSPHKVSEVICVGCCYRWIAARPVDTPLIALECKDCGQGFVIETGEDIGDEVGV